MDVINLINKLESELENCSKVPLSEKLMISEDLLYSYIDQIRASIPDEIKQANLIAKERDRMLSEAEEEARIIIEDAGRKAAQMVSENEITLKAREQAEGIVREAAERGKQVTKRSLEYSEGIMDQLSRNLELFQTSFDTCKTNVKEGREQLRSVLSRDEKKEDL